MTSIALCVIARDEERMLPGLLRSVAGVVDRVIVVDTGSRDRTRELAREAGAEVVEHAWSDDFAAARNAALPHVREDWVLVLDADERLEAGAGPRLRAALEHARFDFGVLALHDADALDAPEAEILSGARRRGEPVDLPRVLRRTDDLRWEGIVHEQPTAWILKGRVGERLDARIVHYGAVPELRSARGKDSRNRELLETWCADHPEDVVARATLAREWLRVDDVERAFALARQAWTDLLELGDRGAHVSAVLPATVLAFLALRRGELDLAAAVLEEARRRSEPHPNLHLLEGLVHERRLMRTTDSMERVTCIDRAERGYRAALALHGGRFLAEMLPGATSWATWTRLGTVQLLAQRTGEARASFARSLVGHPDPLESELGLVECLLDRGEELLAIQAIEPLLAPDEPDAWILAALACARAGLRNDAANFTRQALAAMGSKPLVADHRARRLPELQAALSEGPSALDHEAASYAHPA